MVCFPAFVQLTHAELLFNNVDYHDAMEEIKVMMTLNPNHEYALELYKKVRRKGMTISHKSVDA